MSAATALNVTAVTQEGFLSRIPQMGMTFGFFELADCAPRAIYVIVH
jgi:hypothetical protein